MKRARMLKIFSSSIVAVGATAVIGAYPAGAASGIVPVGAGSYTTVQPSGAAAPQSTIYKTSNVSGPMPTNKWWSSVAWTQYSNTMYPNPFQITASSAGLKVNDPDISASSVGIFGDPSNADFTLGSTASSNFPSTNVDGFSDWTVSMKWDNGAGGTMRVTSGEGLPYLYATYTGGNPVLTFSSAPSVYSGTAGSNVLGITINGHNYGLFAPTGATWSGIGSSQLTCNLPSGTHYFSIATLPDNGTATLQTYQQYAYNFVTNTSVNWSVDSNLAVHSTYNVTTQAMQGNQSGTILALYPAQWKALNTGTSLLPYTYASVHGTMKTLAGTSFSTTLQYHGTLPYLPPVGSYNKNTLDSDVQSVVNESNDYTFGTDTYGAGKAFERIANVIPLAQSVGDTNAANNLEQWLESNMSQYFTATDASGNEKTSNLFWHDNTWGTLIGYPDSYGSASSLNDHVFHYGYWIHAAAQIALDNPSWASQSQWGGMVNQLVNDIATDNRSDPNYPFLRNFDDYAGHSWASGNAEFDDGNNLESSSEAIQAWAGLIEWGEATNQPSIENLGIYLYTTEVNAVQQYWFNVDGTNFPAGYPNDYTAMQWGGKSVYQTWFSSDPEMIRGINILPVTGASLYLGDYPAYDQKFMNQLVQEYGSNQWKNWADILWEFQALYDPSGAINLFNANPGYTPEQGESTAHTYSWLYDMQSLGKVNPGITANTGMYTVFRNNSGQNTYVAYNPSSSAATITFSDGTQLPVPAASMAWKGAQSGTFNSGSGGITGGSGSGGTSGGGTGTSSGGQTGTGNGYSYSIASASSSSALVTFSPTSTMQYVILHYTVNGGTQQNVNMASQSNGSWSYTIPGLNTGDSINYSFTYNNGTQSDSPGYTWSFSTSSSGGSGSSSGSGQSGTGSGYSYSIAPSSTSAALVTFSPTSTMQYVILHYTVNGGIQQNVNMASQSNGSWTYTIPGLNSGDTINYSFTYNSGTQSDSPAYSWTFTGN